MKPLTCKVIWMLMLSFSLIQKIFQNSRKHFDAFLCFQDCRQVSNIYSTCLYEAPWSRFVHVLLKHFVEDLYCISIIFGLVFNVIFFLSISFLFSIVRLPWFWVLMRKRGLNSSSVIQLAIFSGIRYMAASFFIRVLIAFLFWCLVGCLYFVLDPPYFGLWYLSTWWVLYQFFPEVFLSWFTVLKVKNGIWCSPCVDK